MISAGFHSPIELQMFRLNPYHQSQSNQPQEHRRHHPMNLIQHPHLTHQQTLQCRSLQALRHQPHPTLR